MTEKNMQTMWTKYIEAHQPKESEVWELKFTKTSSLRFDAVKNHQRDALLLASSHGLYHKIQDIPVTYYGSKARFTHQSPFDCMFITDAKAFVVVWFYKPRQPKIFIKIDIRDFLLMEKATERKSFTEEMALKYGYEININN
jgi:hypothetical protein